MAHTNVSSCVLSIVASFSSGLDVFKQLREKRRRKKRSKASEKLDDEEIRLARSLRQGPEDIGREYQKSVQAAGDYFAVGDVIAQTSLAEILLKLNTGLVTIISSFLSGDKKDVQLDYHSLTTLSERSRVDTCRTLRQLFKRMAESRSSKAAHSNQALQSIVQMGEEFHARGEKKKRRRKAEPKQNKVHEPMLARVVIENSSKPSQIALVKPGERRKKSTSSSVSRTHSEAPSATSTPLSSPPPYDVVEQSLQPLRPFAQRSNTLPEVSKARRKRSDVNLSSPPLPAKPEALRATRSTPRLQAIARTDYEPLPPLPSRPLLEDGDRRRRKATPTYYSVASDSTKLGEIPLHRWPVPFDFDAMNMMNKEAELNGWPVNQLDDAEGKKKRFGLMRLFRKKITAV